MRISKEPEERRNEILDTAQRLFSVKGYSLTTIADIADEIGIAKGTFYYYYKSKEEIMDAIIQRTLTQKADRAKQIIADETMTATEKLFIILMDQNSNEDEADLEEQFHQPENGEMHLRSMKQVILQMGPVLAEVVWQGVDENLFSTQYPLESVEILLASSSMLFDKGIFHWSDDEKRQRAKAFVYIMEQVLGAGNGCFDEILQLISK